MMRLLLFVYFLIFGVFTTVLRVVCYTRVTNRCVELNQGIACGIPSLSANGHEFSSFFSLRYAQPPLGNLRFKDLRKFTDWRPNQILNVSQFGPVCPQWDHFRNEFIGEEDCLYLNVFTPRNSFFESEEQPTFPVVVFIHGGLGFSSGGSIYYGPKLLIDEDKVLVTVQYRLGPLGFLSSSSSVISGNFGLLDVLMALRWVNENIVRFGGDPNRVTLMGHGSGGAIVSLLIVSPLAEGLFSSAVVHSGSCFCDWSIQHNPRHLLMELSKRLNCSHNFFETEENGDDVDEDDKVIDDIDDDQILECLRNASASKLITTTQKLTKHGFFPVLAAPVIDGDWRENPVLPEHPRLIYDKKKHNRVSLLAGETTHEGIYLYRALETELNKNGSCLLDDEFMQKLLIDVFDDNYDFEELWDSFRRIYFSDMKPTHCDQFLPSLIEFLGDLSVSTCVDDLVRAHSKSTLTYYYVFALRNYSTFQHPLLVRLQNQLDAATVHHLRSYFNGAVCHGDDLSYIFNIDHSVFFVSVPHVGHLRRNLLDLWSGFIDYGHFKWTPSRNRHDFLPEWPSFNESHQEYLHLSTAFTVHSKYRHRERSTWRHLMANAHQSLERKNAWASCKEPYFTITWILLTTTIIACLGVLAALRCAQENLTRGRGTKV